MAEPRTKQVRRAPRQAGRRRFLADLARTVGGVTLLGLGVGLYSRQAASLPAEAIRPPGALAEADFLGACIRCGLCVRDCPYDTLRLAELGESVATGTPYFIAREVPCEMCEDIPCVKACPTGALDHALEDIDQARMGLAVLVDQESCIAFQGLRCEVCYNICPVRGKAISLELRHNPRSGTHALFIPVVHSDACTGCGKCEEACILEQAAIKVFPLRLAKGELGRHYRLGWQEKEKAGRSLVTPDTQRRFNLPEGAHYDYQSGKVIYDEQAAPPETPFGDDPLKQLNRRQEEQP
ncbi:ferredoxin-type protein NapG [Thiohalobacter sp. IOR34]|uniref:ferredoxin-type protein NapG n=1 Tax=Thiohalobacter sp. IOR34 TaxID=3057176 RepID=UPI0025AF18DA|nr:ferredoxin-type protein NapG [Thiohalobacter sp. IOR34]WJW75360.1 ferredoxin-type protein NapG [Thiohalobacter sp. IOR34]